MNDREREVFEDRSCGNTVTDTITYLPVRPGRACRKLRAASNPESFPPTKRALSKHRIRRNQKSLRQILAPTREIFVMPRLYVAGVNLVEVGCNFDVNIALWAAPCRPQHHQPSETLTFSRFVLHRCVCVSSRSEPRRCLLLRCQNANGSRSGPLAFGNLPLSSARVLRRQKVRNRTSVSPLPDLVFEPSHSAAR